MASTATVSPTSSRTTAARRRWFRQTTTTPPARGVGVGPRGRRPRVRPRDDGSLRNADRDAQRPRARARPPSMRPDEEILTVVDAVSSLGGVRVPTGRIDVCLGASQKCFSAPPGLTTAAISDRAWAAMEERDPHSLYTNFLPWRDTAEGFPYTHLTTEVVALARRGARAARRGGTRCGSGATPGGRDDAVSRARRGTGAGAVPGPGAKLADGDRVSRARTGRGAAASAPRGARRARRDRARRAGGRHPADRSHGTQRTDQSGRRGDGRTGRRIITAKPRRRRRRFRSPSRHRFRFRWCCRRPFRFRRRVVLPPLVVPSEVSPPSSPSPPSSDPSSDDSLAFRTSLPSSKISVSIVSS